jgi:hypothetical protein
MGISVFPPAQAEAGGGFNFQPIADADLASVTSVTFSSIDSKYRALKLVISPAAVNSTGRNHRIELNGINTGDLYFQYGIQLKASVWSSQRGFATGDNFFDLDPSDTATAIYGEFNFFNTNLAVPTTYEANLNHKKDAESSMVVYMNGSLDSTAIINEVKFFQTGVGTFTSGKVYLLGSE